IAFDPEIGRRDDHGNREDREHCEQNSSNHVFSFQLLGFIHGKRRFKGSPPPQLRRRFPDGQGPFYINKLIFLA
ncbi:MAG: hypothetical protein VZR77_02825, partial [Candidatus Enteromonas sp.]|nr:hypothetical protein [Candidatus Enteromonas sp.]